MNVLFLRTDFITLGPGPRDDQGLEHSESRHFAQISHASTGDFKFIWNDIMAITTDGDGILLKLGRLVQCEHIACMSQTLHLLDGDFLYEKCSLGTMQGTLQNIRV